MQESYSKSAVLQANAWTGDASPASAPDPKVVAHWALQQQSLGPNSGEVHMGPKPVELWDWRHPKVGWGLVLPDNMDLPPQVRGSAEYVPEPLRRLLESRPGSPVLRWNPSEGNEVLRRYDAKGGYQPLSLISDDGIAPGALPRYLLIAASPKEIPWSFQYAANMRRYVGRLDLDDQALSNYVDALILGWRGSPRDVGAPLVWSVDHGSQDITWLMDQAISRKLFEVFANDEDKEYPRRIGLFGKEATGLRLINALRDHQPALITTTSHGMTGPLQDPSLTAAQLGIPVDSEHQLLDIEALCLEWSPNGAIWYSQACCAAGSDATSQYAGLFPSSSDVMKVLDGVAEACGACTAPLPKRLLGVKHPLAAFVGHVEPTFNWTLRDPRTGQPLAGSIRRALYDQLHTNGGGRPLGWALAQIFEDASALQTLRDQAVHRFNKGLPGTLDSALINYLTSLDRQHTVILGDPTVSLPLVNFK